MPYEKDTQASQNTYMDRPFLHIYLFSAAFLARIISENKATVVMKSRKFKFVVLVRCDKEQTFKHLLSNIKFCLSFLLASLTWK